MYRLGLRPKDRWRERSIISCWMRTVVTINLNQTISHAHTADMKDLGWVQKLWTSGKTSTLSWISTRYTVLSKEKNFIWDVFMKIEVNRMTLTRERQREEIFFFLSLSLVFSSVLSPPLQPLCARSLSTDANFLFEFFLIRIQSASNGKNKTRMIQAEQRGFLFCS